MLGMNLRGSPQIKLYSMLVGLVLGYGLSYAAGLFSPGAAMNIAQIPWVSVPHIDGMWNFAFRWSLLPTFIIVALSGAVKSMGNLVTCQKINDDHWAGPDMGRVGQGLRADGLAVLISGLIGGYATDTSSSNVGLSSASAVTSRVIGFSLGGLLIALGFLPKLSAVLAVMPSPVAGAVLLYVTCVMIFSGLQMILTTKPDTRVTFAIGLAMICGFSLTMIPELYMHLPSYLRPIFDSSIALTVVVAVVLNVLFRSMMKQVAPKGEAG
jgi:NCS2 family nucleobase:cation symporter-2